MVVVVVFVVDVDWDDEDDDDKEEEVVVVDDVLLVVGCCGCERKISSAPAAMNAIRMMRGIVNLFLFLTFLLVSLKLGYVMWMMLG